MTHDSSNNLPQVLLVDDDPAWLALVTAAVHDVRVRTVSDPRDVSGLLERLPVRLIVTDTNMPGMNGVELLQEIRSDRRWDAIPILVLFSGLNGSTITENHLFRLGATVVLTKSEFITQWKTILEPLLAPS